MANYPNFQSNPVGGFNGMNLQSSINNMPFVQSPQMQYPSSQMIFPQPAGSVYNLNTASEIGNVPAGTNISVGLCLNENILYIKALQNGNPVLLTYKLQSVDGQNTSQDNFQEALANISNRVSRLEGIISNGVKPEDNKDGGGKLNWQV